MYTMHYFKKPTTLMSHNIRTELIIAEQNGFKPYTSLLVKLGEMECLLDCRTRITLTCHATGTAKKFFSSQ